MRSIQILAIAFLSLTFQASVKAADEPSEPPIPWPDSATFKLGEPVPFRLPYFQDYKAYPDIDPLYNVLQLPKDYDPERAYPLCIEFQPSNAKPGVWQLGQMSEWQGILLGVSDVLINKDNGTFMWLPVQAGTVAWVLRHWNIDRSRIFVGGFSGGGWGASEFAMNPLFRDYSTHFVIMGAGLRGDPHLELFPAGIAWCSAGQTDMNHDFNLQAVTTLKAAKWDVSTFVEPGIGHDVGPQTRAKVHEWFQRFDPAAHGKEWLTHASAQLSDSTVKDKSAAIAELARVATLGPKNDTGKEAIGLLQAQEGEALAAYNEAYQLLREQRYPQAQKAYGVAAAAAKKARSARLFTWCQKDAQMMADWEFLDQLLTAHVAMTTGRPVEASILMDDGSTRYKAMPELKLIISDYFENSEKALSSVAKSTKAPDPKRSAAQKDLAKFDILSLTVGLKGDPAIKKAQETLLVIETTYAGAPESAQAHDLLKRLLITK